MGAGDILYFDSDEYARELKALSYSDLVSRCNNIMRKVAGQNAHIVVHIGTSPLTVGVHTAVGLGFAYRQLAVLTQKAVHIEEECQRRGLPVPRVRTRDLSLGFLTMGVVGYGTQLLD